MSRINIKQRDLSDCGAACLASVSAHYGLFTSVAKIRKQASTDRKGTNMLGMQEGAKKLGFQTKAVKAEMKHLKEVPLPAIAHVVVKKMLEHYVVIYKQSAKQIVYMDPADGRLHKASPETFQSMWTGALLLLLPDDTFEKKNEKISLPLRFWRLLRPHTALLLQALFGGLVFTITGLSTSIYVQKIVDSVIPSANLNLLNLLSVGMLALLLFQLFIQIVQSRLVVVMGQRIDARLVIGFFQQLLHLPQTFFDNMRSGEIISRIGDALKIRDFIIQASLSIVINICILIASFGLMFTYHWKLGVILLALIPAYILIYFITNFLNRKVERRVMEDAAELESQLVESLNNIKAVKNFELETHTSSNTEFKFIKLLRTLHTSAHNSIFSTVSSAAVGRLLVIILFWAGAGYVLQQQISPGELMSFYALIAYFTGPISSIISMNHTYQNARIAADRLFEISDQMQEQDDRANIDIEKPGPIQFDDVHFRYGTRKFVLEGASVLS